MTETVIALCATFIIVAFLFSRAVVQIAHISSVERADLQESHAAQVSHLCNRIQQPERASHVAISNEADPIAQTPDPDVAFEQELTERGTE